MDSWTGHDGATAAGHRRDAAARCTTRPAAAVHPSRARAGRPPCTSAASRPYDATHLGHAATMITFDLVNRVWRDAGHDGAATCRTSPTSTTRCWSGPPATARTGSSWRCARPRCSARTWRRCGSSRRRTTSARSSRSRRSPRRCGELLDDGAAYRLDDGTGDVYFDIAAAPRFGYESNLSRERDAARSSAERGGDPDRAGKRDPLDPLLWRGARDGEPAWDGGDLGPGRPGWHIECAVDRAGPARRHRSTCRAAATTCSSRTTSAPPRTPRAHRHGAVRPPLRARRHDRPGRREDVQVQGQPGLRLPAARRRRRPDGGAAGAARRPLPRRPRSGPTTCSRPASSGWPAGGRPPPRRPGRPGRRAGRVRERLADDLDTPGGAGRGRRLGRRDPRRRRRRPRRARPGRDARSTPSSASASSRRSSRAVAASAVPPRIRPLPACSTRRPAQACARRVRRRCRSRPVPAAIVRVDRRAACAGAARRGGGRDGGVSPATRPGSGSGSGVGAGIRYSSVSVVIGPGQVAWATSIGLCVGVVRDVQQVQHRRVRPDLQDLGLLPAGLAGADRVGGGGVPPADRLLGLLVERPAERLGALQRGAGGVGGAEPGGADLDRWRRRCARGAGGTSSSVPSATPNASATSGGAGSRPTATSCWRYRAARSAW